MDAATRNPLLSLKLLSGLFLLRQAARALPTGPTARLQAAERLYPKRGSAAPTLWAQRTESSNQDSGFKGERDSPPSGMLRERRRHPKPEADVEAAARIGPAATGGTGESIIIVPRTTP